MKLCIYPNIYPLAISSLAFEGPVSHSGILDSLGLAGDPG